MKWGNEWCDCGKRWLPQNKTIIHIIVMCIVYEWKGKQRTKDILLPILLNSLSELLSCLNLIWCLSYFQSLCCCLHICRVSVVFCDQICFSAVVLYYCADMLIVKCSVTYIFGCVGSQQVGFYLLWLSMPNIVLMDLVVFLSYLLRLTYNSYTASYASLFFSLPCLMHSSFHSSPCSAWLCLLFFSSILPPPCSHIMSLFHFMAMLDACP